VIAYKGKKPATAVAASKVMWIGAITLVCS